MTDLIALFQGEPKVPLTDLSIYQAARMIHVLTALAIAVQLVVLNWPRRKDMDGGEAVTRVGMVGAALADTYVTYMVIARGTPGTSLAFFVVSFQAVVVVGLQMTIVRDRRRKRAGVHRKPF